VAHLGTSSVRYEVGLFGEDSDTAAACGHFVHVYVDRESRRPASLPYALKTTLETLR
jgi:acyl-CoA thioester hydrolase